MKKVIQSCAFIVFIGGAAHTMAQDGIVTKIAVIGCHRQHSPAPALEFFADQVRPDFAIWVGDNVYADTRTDAQYIAEQLEVLANKPGFGTLRNNTPFLVTWDDHDYGLNNAGGDYSLKVESRNVHRMFWELEDEIPSSRSGVFYAKRETLSNGKVIQFLMIDGRYNRGNPSDPEADALGEDQWTWLAQELEKQADLRLFVSGYQVLLELPTRWEAWIKIGRSRQRLFDLLSEKQVNNLLFITGDQHYAEVLQSANSLPYNTYEIMASGINQSERAGKARNRIAGPDKTHDSSPVLEVHWTDDPFIRFLVYDAQTGRISLEHILRFSEIYWRE